MHHPDLSTELSWRLGIDWPLIQAPLGGGPSTPALVAAVSNAGALGSLGCAYMSPEQIESAIGEIRRPTQRPFGVNLFAPCTSPAISSAQMEAALAVTRGYRNELGLGDPVMRPPFQQSFDPQMAVVLQAKPRVFSFTFGMPDQSVIDECRRAGILTMGTATTVEEGLALEELGVDAVVAQGIEAGGHRGIFDASAKDHGQNTLVLVCEMAKALRSPVAASGGLMTGKDIAAALVSGAQAAHLGTAFLLCDEAGTTKPYREALRSAGVDRTRLTRVFSGRWARGLENRFMTEMELHRNAILPFPIQNAFTRDIRKKAVETGRAEFLSLWAGQGAGSIREIPAGELVEVLREETMQALRLLPS
ncbi:MAG TPA: nitronate monooxygenase [Bryobacteraceae bacterium]|jgi:nitronate monooxygenase|nr:nitronate monooxygenase [Bryobacteraceae bacterium]